MGFLDKLRDAVNTAKDSITNTINSTMGTNTQPAQDPLADPTVKKYFEIICGMKNTFSSTGEEPVTGNIMAKKYVEYFLGSPCDEAILQNALNSYNLSRTCHDGLSAEQEILSRFRKSLNDSQNYRIDRFKAYRMFYQDEIDIATNQYNQILNVIKDNINYKHFSQGLSKTMDCNSTIKNIVIADSFYEGNPITRKLVLDYFLDIFINRMNDSTSRYSDPHDAVALVVLKALHFESFSGDKDSYTSVTDSEYRSFVSSVPFYKKAIDDNPFEQEKYINKLVELIKDNNVFNSVFSSYRSSDSFHLTCESDYFCDTVCNMAWKEISNDRNWITEDGEDVSQTKDPSHIFNILCTYFRQPNR